MINQHSSNFKGISGKKENQKEKENAADKFFSVNLFLLPFFFKSVSYVDDIPTVTCNAIINGFVK